MSSTGSTQNEKLDVVSLKRRYNRSVNLERDLDDPHAVRGYVPTGASMKALVRIGEALRSVGAARAFTLTAVYGTGKSAFAHFLCQILSDSKSPGYREARKIITESKSRFPEAESTVRAVRRVVKSSGLMPIAATCSARPLSEILQAPLLKAASSQPQTIASKMRREIQKAYSQEKPDIVALLTKMTALSDSGLVLILDEMGKALEFSARKGEDIFAFQQIAEMREAAGKPLLFLGILHQAFSEYATETSHRASEEWAKVQGRFEDIPLVNDAEASLSLMASAIEHPATWQGKSHWLENHATKWHGALAKLDGFRGISAAIWREVYPLHPVAARALPELNTRFGQNDRSLFNFLTGHEAFSFRAFLSAHKTPQSLKLHHLYDYYAATLTAHSRLKSTRWPEIKSLIDDSGNLGEIAQRVFKTIGVLNLISQWGTLRASRDLILLALCDSPDEDASVYENTLKELEKRGLLLYRKRADEYRLWEGSEFDIESAIAEEKQKPQGSVAEALNEMLPHAPKVAERHSFETGTLRYFAVRFMDTQNRESLLSRLPDMKEVDGVLLVALDDHVGAVSSTEVSVPIVLMRTAAGDSLADFVRELWALRQVLKSRQPDTVARRELRHRITQTETEITERVQALFRDTKAGFHFRGKSIEAGSIGAALSEVCDRIYGEYSLRNDLVNRRETSANISKAIRTVLLSMATGAEQENLGLTGSGPDVTIYRSLLFDSGIHRAGAKNVWRAPATDSGLAQTYQKMQSFLFEATEEPLNVAELFERLIPPPFGAREPVLTILLLSLLLRYEHRLNLYHRGTFLPALTVESLEMLYKRPDNFAIKHFKLTGLRQSFFEKLNAVFHPGGASSQSQSPLSVVRPLLKFAASLPDYTRQTERLSPEARSVRAALFSATEPDILLFRELPRAVGLPELKAAGKDKPETATLLSQKLLEALRQLQDAYAELLSECGDLLLEALREPPKAEAPFLNLRRRAEILEGHIQEASMLRFVRALARAGNPDSAEGEKKFIEAVFTVVADKSPRSWNDADFQRAQRSVADLTRRFINLEFLYSHSRLKKNDAFESRMISFTWPSGKDKKEILHYTAEDKARAEKILLEIAESLGADFEPQTENALLCVLAERIFSEKNPKSEVPTLFSKAGGNE